MAEENIQIMSSQHFLNAERGKKVCWGRIFYECHIAELINSTCCFPECPIFRPPCCWCCPGATGGCSDTPAGCPPSWGPGCGVRGPPGSSGYYYWNGGHFEIMERAWDGLINASFYSLFSQFPSSFFQSSLMSRVCKLSTLLMALGWKYTSDGLSETKMLLVNGKLEKLSFLTIASCEQSRIWKRQEYCRVIITLPIPWIEFLCWAIKLL